MSQDAEQPRSRKDLRRAQLSTSSNEVEAPEYPSVPLLPSPESSAEPVQEVSPVRHHGSHAAPLTGNSEPAEGQRGESAQSAARSRRAQESTRQTRRAEERARNAAVAPLPLALPEAPTKPPSASAAASPVATSSGTDLPEGVELAANEQRSSRRALDVPADGTAPDRVERSSEVRARDRAALRAYREVVDAVEVEAPLPSRKLLRKQQIDADRAPATNPQQILDADSLAAAKPMASDNATASSSMAAALAERDALVNDARAQLESMPPNGDPLTVDLEVLAQQKALAERAAILNERAQARARLAEESADARQKLNDPTTAHNLAMVTPLQFVKVPGVERPVLQAPATSHVPVVTRSNPTLLRPSRPPSTPPKSMPAVAAPTADQASAADESNQRSRAQVLRLAEQAARVRPAVIGKNNADQPVALKDGEVAPMPAQRAHGLEPLDAVTAGLGRVQRNRFLQWGVAVIGLGALIAGVSMIIITSMAR